ncbi:MAG: NAD(+) synthase [Bacilli bacterium]|jgi:NAD+ synthase (glutamine-hydrolysing)|nr:NAD(+) synthase [Bacilli bacterium]
MNKTQPITALRDTTKLKADLAANEGCLFITKNGYSDLVILSPEYYERLAESSRLPFLSPRTQRNPIKTHHSAKFSDPMGFVRVRAESLHIEVAGLSHNVQEIENAVKRAAADKVSILTMPELCLTGYTAEDLFLTSTIQNLVFEAIKKVAFFSRDFNVFFVFGAPLIYGNAIYNCAVAIHQGKVLGVVPKSHLPNYSEFYEKRHFTEAPKENGTIDIGGEEIPFGTGLLFVDENYPDLKIGIEICEDAWVPDTPSTTAAKNGADVILNLSASNEVVGKKEFRENLVGSLSARLCCAYVYASAGDGESTTDLVFAAHDIISENGKILAETDLFGSGVATAEIDLEKLMGERRKMTSFGNAERFTYESVYFSMPLEKPEKLERHYPMNPFIPEGKGIDLERVSLILSMQAAGLVKRLSAIHCKVVLVGLSGGLDSTLALLVCHEAFKKLGYDYKGIHAITMPAFGTSKRTHDNAVLLAQELGISFEEIAIKDSLRQHFKDIHHDENNQNLTYENAQARERTQLLMDYSGDLGGIMVGTGDLSELCLGWTTYNGDHMSMYGVNASIPKTLVRYLVSGYALLHPKCADSLNDIVDTPISPELLPTDSKGRITQKTEDKVGPYELNDFFIYHFLRFGYRPAKLFFLAKQAYAGVYDDATIKKWLRAFFNRFFHNQFKRSCLPDGAKVGTVAISPRGDLRMPSDASVSDFLGEVDAL